MYMNFLILTLLIIIIARVDCLSIFDVSVVATVKCSCERVSNLNVNLTKVYYYNYAAGSTEPTVYGINEAADYILNRNDFDKTQPFDIFVIGFLTEIDNPAIDNVRCIFSQLKTNAVIVDHIAYTSSSDDILTLPYYYNQAVKYTKSIGFAIGKFLCKLLKIISKRNINIAGHSLGAQMVGYAAEYVKEHCGSLHVIYGLDPAKPCYDDCTDEHIQKGQAELVVTIQCSSVVGSTAEMADFNFISNNGVTQDGCPSDTLLNGVSAQTCDHYECVSIGLNTAIRSGIWVANKCANSGDTTCSGPEKTMAGYRVQSTGKHGKYRFDPWGLVCDKKQVN